MTGGDRQPAARLTIEDFNPMSVGALRGFCDVTITIGMILHRCSVFWKDGKDWALAPSKPMIGRDSMVVKDAAGKVLCVPAICFVSKDVRSCFGCVVIEAVRASHPEALE